jgi:hypothetical protein
MAFMSEAAFKFSCKRLVSYLQKCKTVAHQIAFPSSFTLIGAEVERREVNKNKRCPSEPNIFVRA